MRRTAVLAITTIGTLAALQSPALALYDKCATYGVLNPNGTGTEVHVCVNVNGSYRGGYLVAYPQNGGSSIYLDISSLYLRQCDGYGNNCVVIAQNSGVSGGGTSTQFFGDLKPLSFGHTYIACASLTANGDRYTNICSYFRAN